MELPDLLTLTNNLRRYNVTDGRNGCKFFLCRFIDINDFWSLKFWTRINCLFFQLNGRKIITRNRGSRLHKFVLTRSPKLQTMLANPFCPYYQVFSSDQKCMCNTNTP